MDLLHQERRDRIVKSARARSKRAATAAAGGRTPAIVKPAAGEDEPQQPSATPSAPTEELLDGSGDKTEMVDTSLAIVANVDSNHSLAVN